MILPQASAQFVIDWKTKLVNPGGAGVVCLQIKQEERVKIGVHRRSNHLNQVINVVGTELKNDQFKVSHQKKCCTDVNF